LILQISGHGKETNLFNEIQNILIVNEFNVAPINLLFLVFFLFHLEHMLLHIISMSKEVWKRERERRKS